MIKKQPTITRKQTDILLHIHKYRFLTTFHIQKLFGHKDPQRTQAWLKDLFEQKYIKRHFDRKTFEDSRKQAVYYLAPKARLEIHKEKKIDLSDLEYIYSEHRRKEKFVNHCLFLADVYLFLLSQKEETEELKLFTKVDLLGYKYFPDPMPDAYISVKGEKKTRRYFLDLFDEYTPSWVLRQRVRSYLEYSEKSEWDENTDSTPLPSILFICPNEVTKTHIYKYSKAVFAKTYQDNIQLFLTSKSVIQTGRKENVWEKVE